MEATKAREYIQGRYEVVESRCWKHVDGRTASIYGACPWTSAAGREDWEMVTRGWTIRDNVNGTVGLGRTPFATEDEAYAWREREIARYAAA